MRFHRVRCCSGNGRSDSLEPGAREVRISEHFCVKTRAPKKCCTWSMTLKTFVRKRVLQKIMLHVKRAFQYISLRKRVLHKDALYAKYAFYHFTKLNRRQRLGDGMICLRVGKWFEGKSFAGVMCLVYLLHSGKRCGCFKCFGVFISPKTRDSFDVQVEVNSLKKKRQIGEETTGSG